MAKNEIKQISRTTAKIYRLTRHTRDWVTARFVVERTGISIRTVRGALSSLSQAGILEEYPVHGGYRYRAKTPSTVGENGKELIRRLLDAEVAFDLVEDPV